MLVCRNYSRTRVRYHPITLSMNPTWERRLPAGVFRKGKSQPPLAGKMPALPGSWSQCMRKNERRLSMNRPLAERPLTPPERNRVRGFRGSTRSFDDGLKRRFGPAIAVEEQWMILASPRVQPGIGVGHAPKGDALNGIAMFEEYAKQVSVAFEPIGLQSARQRRPLLPISKPSDQPSLPRR